MNISNDKYYILVLNRGFIEYIDKDIENGKTEYGTNLLPIYAKKYTYNSAMRLKRKLLEYGEPFVKVLGFENDELVVAATYTKENDITNESQNKTEEKEFITYETHIDNLTPREMALICKENQCKDCPLCFRKTYPRVSTCIFTNTKEKLDLTYNTDVEYINFKKREVKIVC